MRNSGRQKVIRPRRAYVGVFALFLLMSVYQCGKDASEPQGPVGVEPVALGDLIEVIEPPEAMPGR